MATKKKPKKARPKKAKNVGSARTRRRTLPKAAAGPYAVNRFGWALEQLFCGRRVRRRGWTGHATQSIELQRPDKHSKMTYAYMFINTVQGGRVPFIPSHGDLLSDDWEIAV